MTLEELDKIRYADEETCRSDILSFWKAERFLLKEGNLDRFHSKRGVIAELARMVKNGVPG